MANRPLSEEPPRPRDRARSRVRGSPPASLPAAFRRASRLLGFSSASRWLGTIVAVVPPLGCVLPVAPGGAPSLLDRVELEGGSGAPAPQALGGDRPMALADLQRRARARSTVVAEWNARLAAAEARVRQARSAYFPDLASTGRFLRLDEEITFVDPLGAELVVSERDAYTQTTVLSYSLLDWGRRHFEHQSSLQQVAGSEAEQRRALEELDFAIALAFYGLVEARSELRIAEASVASLEGSLELARDLRAVERATDRDVLVVSARLERRRFESRQLGDAVRDLEDELARLLDVPFETVFVLAEPEAVPPAARAAGEAADPEAFVAAWEDQALLSRAELDALDAQHESVAGARRAEIARFLPQIGLFVEHEYTTSESILTSSQVFAGGVTASWELFSGGRRAARLGELAALADELRAQHRRAARAIQAEVRSAVRAMHRTFDGMEVAGRVVHDARENLARVTDLFREGRATGQEVLEAESLLRIEEAKQEGARYEVLRSYARLKLACGLGCEDELAVPESDGRG